MVPKMVQCVRVMLDIATQMPAVFSSRLLLVSVVMGAVGGLMVWWLHDSDDMLTWLRSDTGLQSFDPLEGDASASISTFLKQELSAAHG